MRTILEILEHLHAATVYASDLGRSKVGQLLSDFRSTVEAAEAAERDITAGATPVATPVAAAPEVPADAA